MSESWDRIVEEAEGYFQKSAHAHELNREQKVDRFLKTERGRRLWAEYASDGGESLADLAKEELIAKSATIARIEKLGEHDALIRAVEQYRDLAVAAGISKALLGAPIAKDGGDAWARIEAGADAWVQKSGDVDLDRSQVIDRFLKTAEGRALYAQYVAERSV
ncbi:MAG: hypothetical protein KGL39_41305 [Patescibacteria group bacterium]|nr:hypothetical protein [Patescibacteria group bacterium]